MKGVTHRDTDEINAIRRDMEVENITLKGEAGQFAPIWKHSADG